MPQMARLTSLRLKFPSTCIQLWAWGHLDANRQPVGGVLVFGLSNLLPNICLGFHASTDPESELQQQCLYKDARIDKQFLLIPASTTLSQIHNW